MKASRRVKTEKSTSTLVKCEGFAHEFLAQSRTVNKKYYRVRQIHFLLESALKKKLLNIFSNFFFYLKVQSFLPVNNGK